MSDDRAASAATSKRVSASSDATTAASHDSHRRRLPHVRIALAVGAAVIATLVAISLGDADDVAAVVVSSESFSAALTARGRLEAAEMAAIGAETPGRIEAVLVRVGDSVAAGAPVLRLDAEVARAQYRAATAMAASAVEGVQSARAEVTSAEVQLAERRADLERIAPLAGTAVAAADVETARAAVEKAESDLARAAARLAQAEAQATAATADRDAAQRVLDDLVVRAPITGVVVSRDVDSGDVVGAGSTLLTLANPASLEVVAYVDETRLNDVRIGLPVEITLLSNPGTAATGTVRAIGHEVDADTREVELWVALTGSPARWALGQRADVRITSGGASSSTAVPTGMVSWQGADAGVYVAADGRARWVPVALGRADDRHVELTGSIQPGDTILAPDGLRPGRRVTPLVVMATESP